jgi:hypothetical protein
MDVYKTVADIPTVMATQRAREMTSSVKVEALIRQLRTLTYSAVGSQGRD